MSVFVAVGGGFCEDADELCVTAGVVASVLVLIGLAPLGEIGDCSVDVAIGVAAGTTACVGAELSVDVLCDVGGAVFGPEPPPVVVELAVDVLVESTSPTAPAGASRTSLVLDAMDWGDTSTVEVAGCGDFKAHERVIVIVVGVVLVGTSPKN